eukprot:4801203-Amphidinium_carterae.1
MNTTGCCGRCVRRGGGGQEGPGESSCAPRPPHRSRHLNAHSERHINEFARTPYGGATSLSLRGRHTEAPHQ